MVRGRLQQRLADARREGWADWVRSEADERAVLNGCRFEASLGQHVVDFFATYLCLGDGQWAGQPFILLPWQRDGVIMPLFGWVREDGSRRFRDAYVSVAKKNGKSPLGAGIGLYLLVGDDEPGARICSVATELQQANIVHSEAIRMVKASPALKRRLKINHATWNIADIKTNSWYRAFSAEPGSKEGFNLHGGIGDELHVWKGPRLLDALRYAFVSRRQPLFFKITTAGVADQTAIGWEEYDRAVKVRDGQVPDDEKFVYIAESTGKDDWKSPDTWAKANPSLGVTIQADELEKACVDAQNTPRLENEFRRYRLNQWVGQESRWISMEKWDACAEPVDWDELRGAECWGGLDLASKLDLTAFVLVFPYHDGYAVKPYFFAPREKARDRERKDRVPYVTWARQGLLELTPGYTTSHGHIRKRINTLAGEFNILQIGFDPWAATQLRVQLEDEDGIEMVEVRQGFHSLSDASKEFEALIVDGKLYHEANPIMRWMVSNLAAKTDEAENVKPDKKRSSDKIDGPAATITALSLALRHVDEISVYETRGLLTV